MDIAALITWLITALGGFYMLGTWLSRGGAKAGNSRLPVPVISGHFALAAVGLVVWIIYVITDEDALAWTAFGLLVPVALLGFAMLARWLPVHRARSAAAAPGAESEPAERYFPVPVVAGHGLFAVVTVVLVLLTALGIGGS
ncbi:MULTISPECIES: hypothetical protein [unclassified Streptomyces]|uniref:hypothetical protein n=1 Tax=unclassified Streptomyces TaxID=2593676 RepID=UPI002E181346|nr:MULTISPECIES: hypothetical protein [unclassified Streptomyces]